MSDPVDCPVLALTPPLDATPQVVDLLERMLERAKRGEVLGIAIVAEVQGRIVSTGYHVNDAFRMIGALRWLESRISAETIDGA